MLQLWRLRLWLVAWGEARGCDHNVNLYPTSPPSPPPRPNRRPPCAGLEVLRMGRPCRRSQAVLARACCAVLTSPRYNV